MVSQSTSKGCIHGCASCMKDDRDFCIACHENAMMLDDKTCECIDGFILNDCSFNIYSDCHPL